MEQERERFVALDGLRGVAAVVVVVFHIVICDRVFGLLYSEHGPAPTWWTYVLTYTPARVLWSGSEAVVVFFVLSGFVLTLPFTTPGRARWSSFYPQRLVRLYLPAAASLLLAWIVVRAVPRRVVPDVGPWMNAHALEPTGLSQVLLGSSLLAGWGGLNTSLWSLRWEVVFSLLLPLFLLLGRAWPRLAWLKVVVVLGACAFWPIYGFSYPDAVYIAVFGLGVVMAFNLEGIRARSTRIVAPVWWAVLIVSLCLLTFGSVVAGVDAEQRARQAWIAPAAAGAMMLVVMAVCWPSARSVLGSRAVRWLGTISFSLYLVQEPVVLALEFLTKGAPPLLISLPLELGAAVLVGALFHRFVERPAHRLARRVGSRGAGAVRTGARPPTLVLPQSTTRTL